MANEEKNEVKKKEKKGEKIDRFETLSFSLGD